MEPRLCGAQRFPGKGMRGGPPLPLLGKAPRLALFLASQFTLHCLRPPGALRGIAWPPQGPDGADPAPTWLSIPTHARARTHGLPLHQARKREPGKPRNGRGWRGHSLLLSTAPYSFPTPLTPPASESLVLPAHRLPSSPSPLTFYSPFLPHPTSPLQGQVWNQSLTGMGK